VDLVAHQLRSAAGEPLTLTQQDIALSGHAIEARITVESPERGFQPQPGTVTHWRAPTGPGIRVDTHCESGYVVSPYYDSLLAKVIAHGPDRDTAADRLIAALAALEVEGVPTTTRFARFALDHADFRAGLATTDWIGTTALPDYLEKFT
jgi:acetyl-CoA carboxylase biotin carboxylase subunit